MLPERNGAETRYVLKGPLQIHTENEKGPTTCPPLWSYILDMQQLPGCPSISVIPFPSCSLLTVKVLICHPSANSTKRAAEHRAAHSPSQAGQLGHPALGAGVHKTTGAHHKFPSTGRMTNISFVELAIIDTKYPSTSQRNPGYFFPGPVA